MQKLIDMKGELDNSTIIVGDFNPLLSIKDTKTRHKINKEIEDLNNCNPTRPNRRL